MHENKEILTHNTARFLVLCNIKQKSFTVRASVSLPKVNSFAVAAPAASRPAEITPLSGAQLRRLGSMLGVFRPARAGRQRAAAGDDDSAATLRPAALHAQPLNGSTPTAAAAPLQPPQPIDVSSKTLYVERGGGESYAPTVAAARQPKLLQLSSQLQPPMQSTSPQPRLHATPHNGAAEPDAVAAHNMQFAPQPQPQPQTPSRAPDESPPDAELAPILVTNNHRVSDDLVQVTGRRPMLYSAAAKVDEFALGAAELPDGGLRRPRGGRAGGPQQQPLAAGNDQRRAIESRMGDTAHSAQSTALDLVGAESGGWANYSAPPPPSSNESSSDSAAPPTAVGPTLAQNITGALLRWSLRTLGSFARKSLESLVHDEDESADADGNKLLQVRSSPFPLPPPPQPESSSAPSSPPVGGSQVSAAPPLAARQDKPATSAQQRPAQQTREPKRMAYLHLDQQQQQQTQLASIEPPTTAKPKITQLNKEHLQLSGRAHRTGSGPADSLHGETGAAVWLVGLSGVSVCVICLVIVAVYLMFAPPNSAAPRRLGRESGAPLSGEGLFCDNYKRHAAPTIPTCSQQKIDVTLDRRNDSIEFGGGGGGCRRQTSATVGGTSAKVAPKIVAPSGTPSTSSTCSSRGPNWGNNCNEQILIHSDCVLVDTSGEGDFSAQRSTCKSPNESFA